jgi:hypothetical protein
MFGQQIVTSALDTHDDDSVTGNETGEHCKTWICYDHVNMSGQLIVTAAIV